MELLLGEVLPLFSGEMEEAMPGACMEHVVARLPENEALLVVVVGHDGRTWGLFRKRNQTMDVLHGFEGFLPELHLDGRFQLNKTRVQMHGLGVRVIQVDGSLLMLVFVDVTQMGAQLKRQNQEALNKEEES